MENKYFECKPGELCDGSTCCKTRGTKPALSVGDFIRLSEATGKPITELWKTKGDATITTYSNLRMGEFLVSLGLLHYPCPFLSQENRCTVYDTRPLGCASFPSLLLESHSEQLDAHYSHYACLKGVKLSPRQKRFWKELDQIMFEEAGADIRFLWKNKPPYIHIPALGDYFKMAADAIIKQKERDPRADLCGSRRLIDTVNQMTGIVGRKEPDAGPIVFSTADFIDALTPVMYSIIEDDIAERLANLDKEALDFYKGTTARWKQLARTAR